MEKEPPFRTDSSASVRVLSAAKLMGGNGDPLRVNNKRTEIGKDRWLDLPPPSLTPFLPTTTDTLHVLGVIGDELLHS
ncbi:hypothetical protein CEXT_452391 [Caerostris extrusa]|uniref:Uncharacterized protein n=1 Tax=Caerostris extrusa TaxID=172846 RepID=A0AAV4TD67_CAEEX|nr:hypothetical protein CEXT_452391 [Caerostris extrusa]